MKLRVWIEQQTQSRAEVVRKGFTLKEVVVCLVMVLFFVALGLSWVRTARLKIAKTTCSSNLRYHFVALQDYSQSHQERFPWRVPRSEGGSLEYAEDATKVYAHLQILSNVLLDVRTTICPSDSRMPAPGWSRMGNTNDSYFVGIDSNPHLPRSGISGDRNIIVASPAIVEWNSAEPLHWVKSIGLHGDVGHLLFGDGHVERLGSSGLSNAVQQGGSAMHRFAVP
jgi:prepilin-type processing-associated H-X9-DG protein